MATLSICDKKTLKILFFLQNQESFEAKPSYSIGDSRSTKFIQMMILGWPLAILTQDQICVAIQNVEKIISSQLLTMYH